MAQRPTYRKEDPWEPGTDRVFPLQGFGIGAAHKPHPFLAGNSPCDQRQEADQYEYLRRARAHKGFDSDDPILSPAPGK